MALESLLPFFLGFISMFGIMGFTLQKYEKVFDQSYLYPTVVGAILLGVPGAMFSISSLQGINVYFLVYALSGASVGVLLKYIPFKIFPKLAEGHDAMFYGIIIGAAYGAMASVITVNLYVATENITFAGILVAIATTLDFVLINAASGHIIGRGLATNDKWNGLVQGIVVELPLFIMIFFYQVTADIIVLPFLFAYATGLFIRVTRKIPRYLPKKVRKELFADKKPSRKRPSDETPAGSLSKLSKDRGTIIRAGEIKKNEEE